MNQKDVNGGISKFKEVILWPEFLVAWVLFGAAIGAGAIDALFLRGFVELFGMALLAVIVVSVFIGIYRAARADRDMNIERSELKSILGTLNDALIVYEEGFRAIFFNPAAERLFKIPAASVFGHTFAPQDVEKEGWRTLTQIIFSSLAPRVQARSQEGEYPQIFDLSFTEPQLELRVTTAPVVDDSGRILAFMKIIRDRTAQINALRSRSEFVTVASHQLREPVGDINWALESIAHEDGLSDTSKQILDNALAVSRGLLRKIEDLLNITKMEEGDFGYHFVESDFVEFVAKVLADVLPSAQRANVKLYFDRPAAVLPHVMIDPQRLSLALVNLLENAIRYNVENGEVTVKVDAMPGKPYVVASVKDTGIGIPAEGLSQLFTKFYRAENAAKSQTEGTGLGLYIAKTIINAHGGQIMAESELNRGTTISLALPTDPNLIPKRERAADDFF